MEVFAKSNGVDPSIRAISVAFSGLKAKRAKADYETPQSLFSRRDTMNEIESARRAIELIANLSVETRRQLAIELLLPLSRRDT